MKTDAGSHVFCTYRFLILVLLAASYMSIEMVQSAIGMAIICMVDPADLQQDTNANNQSDCYHNSTELNYSGTLEWNAAVQGLILCCFQFGVLLSPFTGYLGDKVNVKALLTFAVALTAVSGASIPLLAKFSFVYVVAARICMGVGEAVLVPAVNCLIARWFPQAERSFAVGVAYGGRQIGTLTILPLAGYFCSGTFLGGWPATFYTAAMFGALWTCLWLIFGAKDPFSKSFCIGQDEISYLKEHSEVSNEKTPLTKQPRKTPWSKLLKSSAVWAVGISVVCQEYIQITQALFLPTYLKEVFYIDSTINGLASALPPLCLWISRICTAYAANYVQKRFRLNKTTTSKIFNSLGALGVGVFYASTALLDCKQALVAVVLICLALTCCGFHTAGCLEAIVSMAPSYSGIITGLAYLFVSISGIINPLLTKALTLKGTQQEWDIVFFINAGVSFVPLLLFNVWGKADVQDWARDDDAEKRSVKIVERY